MAEEEDLDDTVFQFVHDEADRIRSEAGLFAPTRNGPLTRSTHSYPIYIVERNRGIHRWLCRLGLHAWQDRWRSGHPNTRATYCAVCGVPRG